MLAYRPLFRPRLGQLSQLTSGLTSGLAKQIVDAADPATRAIIKDERNRLAESLIGGIPFASASALAYVGTRYLVPDNKNTMKAVGYGASALAVAIGAWWTLDHMSETTAPPGPEGGIISDVAGKTAQEIVAAADPKIRAIVDEEKARAVSAAKAGLPFAVASFAAFLATMFLVEDNDLTVKALGYSSTALLLGAGAWVALDKEMEVVTA